MGLAIGDWASCGQGRFMIVHVTLTMLTMFVHVCIAPIEIPRVTFEFQASRGTEDTASRE
jgi:hypothetical protein